MRGLLSKRERAGKLSASLSLEGPNAAFSGSLQIYSYRIHDVLKNVPDIKVILSFTQGNMGSINLTATFGGVSIQINITFMTEAFAPYMS